MKRLFPIPSRFADLLKEARETGFGYQVVSIKLTDGRSFDQVAISNGHIIDVRGYRDIPFEPDDIASLTVNHKRWNFRRSSGALAASDSETQEDRLDVRPLTESPSFSR
jgi:hypothetical protein